MFQRHQERLDTVLMDANQPMRDAPHGPAVWRQIVNDDAVPGVRSG